MKYKYRKCLNPLMVRKAAIETQAPRTQLGISAKADPYGRFSDMEQYAKHSEHGSDPSAGAKYIKYRRRKYSHV